MEGGRVCCCGEICGLIPTHSKITSKRTDGEVTRSGQQKEVGCFFLGGGREGGGQKGWNITA